MSELVRGHCRHCRRSRRRARRGRDVTVGHCRMGALWRASWHVVEAFCKCPFQRAGFASFRPMCLWLFDHGLNPAAKAYAVSRSRSKSEQPYRLHPRHGP